MSGDTVYVAAPSPSRPHEDPDVYHTDEGCKMLAQAVTYDAEPREAVDDLELCDVCAGSDLCGAAQVLARADPDEFPPKRGRSQ
jgi:hypothetical protein